MSNNPHLPEILFQIKSIEEQTIQEESSKTEDSIQSEMIASFDFKRFSRTPNLSYIILFLKEKRGIKLLGR